MKGWGWVALGSALGGGLRFTVGDFLARLWMTAFPWPTLFINAAGALLIGLLAALTHHLSGRSALSPPLRLFAMIGFCGGFTTFSLFSLESLELFRSIPAVGILYVVLTGVVCLIAVWGGHSLGTWLSRD